MKIPSIKKIGEAIGEPWQKWPGNCSFVAQGMLTAKLVEGRFCYGMYHGEISSDSTFGGRAFTHHAWILLPDKRILDPTRWCFEMVKPYVYLSEGTNNPEYDYGGNALKKKFLKPEPGYSADQQQFDFADHPNLHPFLMATFGRTKICQYQIFWLANLPLDMFEGHEKEIYEYLVDHNCGGFIPMDNRRLILL